MCILKTDMNYTSADQESNIPDETGRRTCGHVSKQAVRSNYLHSHRGTPCDWPLVHSRLINQLLKQVIFFCTIKHYLLISDARRGDPDARGDEVYSTISSEEVIFTFTFIFLFWNLCFCMFNINFFLSMYHFILRAFLAIYLSIHLLSFFLIYCQVMLQLIHIFYLYW